MREISLTVLTLGFISTTMYSAIQSTARADNVLNAACDAYASSPLDETRPKGVDGINFDSVDPAKAVPACLAALKADDNNPRILFQTARALEAEGKNRMLAFEYNEKAAAMGHLLAYHNAAKMLQDEETDVPDDYAKAFRYFMVAANGGIVLSMNNLGIHYELGNGVPVDFAAALHWYGKAAENGNVDAMGNLGSMYYLGKGVPVDFVKSAEWAKKSADAGSAAGMNDYGSQLELGEGVAKNIAEAIKYYQMAADAGEEWGMLNLGLMKFYGNGMARDEAAAFELLVDSLRVDESDVVDQLLENPTKGNKLIGENTQYQIEEILKWKGLMKGTPDAEFDDESLSVLRKIRDKQI